jgi:hypothetical protein
MYIISVRYSQCTRSRYDFKDKMKSTLSDRTYQLFRSMRVQARIYTGYYDDDDVCLCKRYDTKRKWKDYRVFIVLHVRASLSRVHEHDCWQAFERVERTVHVCIVVISNTYFSEYNRVSGLQFTWRLMNGAMTARQNQKSKVTFTPTRERTGGDEKFSFENGHIRHSFFVLTNFKLVGTNSTILHTRCCTWCQPHKRNFTFRSNTLFGSWTSISTF